MYENEIEMPRQMTFKSGIQTFSQALTIEINKYVTTAVIVDQNAMIILVRFITTVVHA